MSYAFLIIRTPKVSHRPGLRLSPGPRGRSRANAFGGLGGFRSFVGLPRSPWAAWPD